MKDIQKLEDEKNTASEMIELKKELIPSLVLSKGKYNNIDDSIRN